MLHPVIAAALAEAHRADLLRAAAAPRSGRVARPGSRPAGRSRRRLLADWLDAQLHRVRPRRVVCTAPTS